MLQRAANLLASVNNEEAWHLTSLFQQTDVKKFLRFCHVILADYLELTYDHFDQGWPLTSRLVLSASRKTSGQRLYNLLRPAKATGLFTHHQDARSKESGVAKPLLFTSTYPIKLGTPKSVVNIGTPDCSGKCKSVMAKRLFKQILLPSRPRTPITKATKLISLETGRSGCGETYLSLGRSGVPRNTISPTPTAITSNSHYNVDVDFALWKTRWRQIAFIRPLKCSLGEPGKSASMDMTICQCLIDYMLESPRTIETKGVFRIPGNSARTREVCTKLHEFFQTVMCTRTSKTELRDDESCSDRYHDEDVCQERFQSGWWWSNLCSLLDDCSLHDLTSLLMRYFTVSSSVRQPTAKNSSASCVSLSGNTDDTGGFFNDQAAYLCFLATRLQYSVDWSGSPDDWVPVLCRARQLLTYRMVIQLLLPQQERRLLLPLLRLLHRVVEATQSTRMTSDSLATCTAVAIFGLPKSHLMIPSETTSRPSQVSDIPLKCRIDTLANLINVAEELDVLPTLFYHTIRDHLRSRVGHSPLPRCNTVCAVKWRTNSPSLEVEGEGTPISYCLRSRTGSVSEARILSTKNSSPTTVHDHVKENSLYSPIFQSAPSSKARVRPCRAHSCRNFSTQSIRQTATPDVFFHDWRRHKVNGALSLASRTLIKMQSSTLIK